MTTRIRDGLPASCLLCGQDSAGAVCAPCAGELPRLAGPLCPVCALPTVAGEICGPCLRHPPAYDATCAVFRYDFPVDRLIQALKYQRRLASADFLGAALCAMQNINPPDLIVPVPLSAERLALRGFNQSLELARPLARRAGQSLALDVMFRRRHTAPQAALPWKERARNIRNAFECTADLRGKVIWVVDDVMTTGATLNELARIAKLHGARRVENHVLARALKY